MRELTFRGFLKQYVSALSFEGTNGLYKLAKEAASRNARLREPLFLYALISGKENVLLQATKDAKLREEYTKILELYDKELIQQAMVNGDPELPERYARVYNSYLRLKGRKKNKNYIKLLMRDRILELQRKKGVSTYRLYTDLKINHGNMNTFIKHGNCTGVSLETVRSAVTYLEGL